MCVWMCVRRPAAGPTQAITLKLALPTAHSPPPPLLLLSSLDQSARDYLTIILWNSPGQGRVAHACTI